MIMLLQNCHKIYTCFRQKNVIYYFLEKYY